MKKNLAIPTLTAGVFLLLAAQMFAQTSGVSHPEELNDVITTAPAPAQHYTKPSAGIPVTPPAPAPTPTLLVHETTTPTSVVVEASVVPSAAPLATTPVLHSERDLIVTDDVNSGVVIDVPSAANELSSGTLLHATLLTPLSTLVSVQGSPFSATLSADVLKHGVVLLPAGTVVNGRVAQVRGGRRIGGAAAIRLQPDSITLPSGAKYRLNAEVVDLDHFRDAHVNDEGTIVSNDHAKGTLAALSLTTGSAIVAGAMIGGGVGAVVGAGVGVGAGAIWWLKRDRQQTLPQGTEIVFSLDHSLFVGSGAF